jgi:hypothetical protein
VRAVDRRLLIAHDPPRRLRFARWVIDTGCSEGRKKPRTPSRTWDEDPARTTPASRLQVSGRWSGTKEQGSLKPSRGNASARSRRRQAPEPRSRDLRHKEPGVVDGVALGPAVPADDTNSRASWCVAKAPGSRRNPTPTHREDARVGKDPAGDWNAPCLRRGAPAPAEPLQPWMPGWKPGRCAHEYQPFAARCSPKHPAMSLQPSNILRCRVARMPGERTRPCDAPSYGLVRSRTGRTTNP